MFLRITATALFLTALGCSSSLFEGDQPDSRIVAIKANNQFSQCEGIRLNGNDLRIADARTIVNCLNENGVVAEYQALFEKLTDEQLEPFVRALNSGLINNPERAKAVDLSLRSLERRGLADPAFASLGEVLRNTEFIASFLRLADLLASREPRIVRATALLIAEMEPESWIKAFNVLTRLTRSKAFEQLSADFSSEQDDQPDLHEIVSEITAYGVNSCQREDKNLIRTILSALANQQAFAAFDLYMGYQAAAHDPHPEDSRRLGIDYQIADFTQLTRVLSGADGRGPKLGRMARFLNALNHPGTCFEDIYGFSEAPLWLVDQLTSDGLSAENTGRHLTRRMLITLTMASSLCGFPEEFSQEGDVVFALSETGAVQSGANLLRALRYVENPDYRALTRSALRFLSDPGVASLQNALKALSLRKADADLAYLFDVLDPDEDRPAVANAAQALVEPRPELDGDAVVDEWMRAFSRLDLSPQTIRLVYKTVSGFAQYFDPKQCPDDIAKPLVANLRAATTATTVHPFIDWLKVLSRESATDPKLVMTLLEIARLPEFDGAVELTARMAKDGSLRQIVSLLVGLFRKSHADVVVKNWAEKAPDPLPTIPAERNRCSNDLPQRPFYQPTTFANGVDGRGLGCHSIDLGLSFSDTAHSEWPRQMRSLAACVGNDGHGNFQDVVNFVEYGLSRQFREDTSVLAFFVGQIRELFPDVSASSLRRLRGWTASVRRAAIHELGELLRDAPHDIERGLHFIEMMLRRRSQAPGALFEEVADLLRPLSGVRAETESVFRILATIVESESFPHTVGYLGRLFYSDEPARDYAIGADKGDAGTPPPSDESAFLQMIDMLADEELLRWLLSYLYAHPSMAELQRIANDLTRFESFLRDADFSPGSGENLAVRYLSYLARTAGDPSRGVELIERDVSARLNILRDPLLSLTVNDDTKRRLRSLDQTVDVLYDLRTHRPDDLRVFSDLARVVLSATPESERRRFQFETNKLRFVVYAARAGLFSKLSRSIETLPRSAIEAVLNLVRGFLLVQESSGRWATNRESFELMRFLFSDPKGKTLLNQLLLKLHPLPKGGLLALAEVLSPMIFEPVGGEGLTMGQAVVRIGSPLIIRRAEKWGEALDFVEWIANDEVGSRRLGQLARASKTTSGFEALSRTVRTALRELLKARLADELISIADVLYFDSVSRTRFGRVVETWQGMAQDGHFEANDLDHMLYRFYMWFEDQGPLASRLRAYTAERLRNGDALSVMLFCQSDEFYNQLRTSGRGERMHELADFVHFLRDAMVYNP